MSNKMLIVTRQSKNNKIKNIIDNPISMYKFVIYTSLL